MKFGYFDDRNKEYVITTPQTPLPWINYLGSEDFFSLVSNTAGGYSFYRDARMRTSSSILKEPQKALFLVRFRPVIKA